MDESNNELALERITSEVDESEIKVFLSSHCLEAQEYLAAKLKKQCERHRETCRFITSANLKVEAEIKHAEQEIRSMLITQESLKAANVELRKQWLLAVNRKEDITKRITEGKNKYEPLWIAAKNRYESIPFVKKLIRATEKHKITEKAIVDIDEQIKNLYDNIEIHRGICAGVDKKRCLELANFMVNDMPIAILFINDKSKQIKDVTKEIEHLQKQEKIEATSTKEAILTSYNNDKEKGDTFIQVENVNPSKIEHDQLIPKLNLVNLDIDMDGNLDEVKIKKDKILNAATTRIHTTVTQHLGQKVEQRATEEQPYGYLIPSYFSTYKDNKSRNYSDRKLINILEDISINNSEAYNIVKKVNPDKLCTVGEISAEANEIVTTTKKKEDRPIVSEKIEEVDLTCSPIDSIIIPPTQYLDIGISEVSQKKKVSFDLSASVQIKEIIDENKQDEELNDFVNQTMTSQPDGSAASDDSLLKAKQILLKQHYLDLSPPFVYAKTNILQKKDDTTFVASKFFQGLNTEEKAFQNKNNLLDASTEELLKSSNNKEVHNQKDLSVAMDVDDFIVASPKPDQVPMKPFEQCNSDAPVSGLLFTHGAQGLPDSLNVSMNTTGYEESDFRHCIDTNLLLSPKADVPNDGPNKDITTQEIPNFLTGFRKTFLFGAPSTSTEPGPDSSEQNEGNPFSFNFGVTKKNRGGLFNLFH